MLKKALSLILSVTFLFNQTGLAQAAITELNLPGYFANVSHNLIQDNFRPVHLRYFSYNSLNNEVKVLLDKGNQKNLSEKELDKSTKELLDYFLVGVTLPNDKFWVNLRPDAADQIIDSSLAETDIGKVMLEADLQLKKDTASFTSPQTTEGKEYWNRLYKKAEELYGTENVTIPTLTRPWIVPNEIIVRETSDSAYVYKATLKVLLEQDYLKSSESGVGSSEYKAYEFKDERAKALNEYSTQLIRELIIPKLTKEVNTAKRYAALRQVFYSIIMSRWFKLRFAEKQGLASSYISLIDKQDLTNLTSKSSWSKMTYFDAYKKSFAQGEYNIKEPVYTPTGQVIRSYFSGGLDVTSSALTIEGNRLIGAPVGGDVANTLGRMPGLKLRKITPSGVTMSASALEVGKASSEIEETTKNPVARALIGIHNLLISPGMFPDSVVLNTFSTTAEDQVKDGYRDALLDLWRSTSKGEYVAVPIGPNMTHLQYEYGWFPVIVPVGSVPAVLLAEVLKAKDAQAISKLVQAFVVAEARKHGVNIVEKQVRSHLLDPKLVGEAAIDAESLIATITSEGELIIFVPFWAKRDFEAMEAFNRRLTSSFQQRLTSPVQQGLGDFAEPAPLSWPSALPRIQTSHDALGVLARYSPLFFEEFSRGDLSHANLLIKIINLISADSLIDAKGIINHPIMGNFIATQDQQEPAPGFGKYLDAFLNSLNITEQLLKSLNDDLTLNIEALNRIDRLAYQEALLEIQGALAGLYARIYKYIYKLGKENLEDIENFEPLLALLGEHAQQLNKAIRDPSAMEVNGASAKDITEHLANKGIQLTDVEIENLRQAYARFSNEGNVFAWDILQLAAIFSQEHFKQSFRYLKVDDPRTILRSEMPYEAFDGTGRVGKPSLFLRFQADLNRDIKREPDYIGRYLVRSTSLGGGTDDQKFASAKDKAWGMLNDPAVQDARLGIMFKGSLVPMTQLVKEGRLELQQARTVLMSELDPKHPQQVPCVYPVRILLDNQIVGVMYFVDIPEFDKGLTNIFRETGLPFKNIPRPMIVIEKDGTRLVFEALTEATPGGQIIGDQAAEAAAERGEIALKGPSIWKSTAIDELRESFETMGGNPEELRRLEQLYAQILDARLGSDDRLFITKAQVGKLMPPKGGGFNNVGIFLHRLSKVGRVLFLTFLSCSTNGLSHGGRAMSVKFGGFGTLPITLIGITAHGYTPGDTKGPPGHIYPSTTGAAKGFSQTTADNYDKPIVGSVRVPTGDKAGEPQIKGGSMFDLIIKLPENVPEYLVRSYLEKVAEQSPELLQVYGEQHKVDGRYLRKDTIAGQRTGTIIYVDFIEKIPGLKGYYRVKFAYDNEVSYTHQMSLGKERVFGLVKRQREKAELDTVIQAVYDDYDVAASPVDAKASSALQDTMTIPGVTVVHGSSSALNMGRASSEYGPHPSQEGLRPLFERVAWARQHAPDAFKIKDIYAFEDQKHGMAPKESLSFGLILEDDTHIIQNAPVMGGISFGQAEPGTHPSIKEAIAFFNKNVRQRLIGLNIARPQEITEAINQLDDEFRSTASDKGKPRYSYIGAEIALGISMISTIGLSEMLHVPMQVVENYRYNEYAITHSLATEIRPMSIPVNYGVVWEGGKHGVSKYLPDLVKEGIIKDDSRFPERFKDIALINAGKDKSILLAMVPPQELQLVVFAPNWAQARDIGIKLTEKYQSLLKERGIKTRYGAESGFTTDQLRDKDGMLITLELVTQILEKAVESLSPDEAKYVRFALDIASSEMYIPEIDMYYIGPDAAGNDDGLVNNEGFTKYKLEFFKKHWRFISCEDWADENRLEHWYDAKQIMPTMIQMGDDNVVSRADLIRKFTDAGVMNAHLQKPNQSAEEEAGIEAVATSHSMGNVVIGSHRGTRSSQEVYTALFMIGVGAFGGKWTLWGPGRGALIAAMTQADTAFNNSVYGDTVVLPYQGALVLDPNSPYKNVGWAQRIRSEIAEAEARIDSSTQSSSAMDAQTPVRKTGGIDFKDKTMASSTVYEPMGSFAGLDFNLPKLSSSALANYDLDKEQLEISQAIDNGVLISGERIKEFMAASSALGEFGNRRDAVIIWLAKIGMLEETQCCTEECSKEYKEAIVLADSIEI